MNKHQLIDQILVKLLILAIQLVWIISVLSETN